MLFSSFLTVASDSKFNSKSVALRVQKKVAGKLATTSIAKSFIDDEFSKLLDTLHDIIKAESGGQKADKLIKNIIKMVVKIAILYKNNQFKEADISVGIRLRQKLRTAALTVVSFYEVDFSYDPDFLAKNVNEIGELTHQLVGQHVTQKSHGRIDNIVSSLSNKAVLDKVFTADGQHRDKLPTIAAAFGKVVDSEW